MRFEFRKDLGGYGSRIGVFDELAGIEIDRPFVLLTGPNGAGKSALLRAIRATTGVTGEREGRFPSRDDMESAADPETVGSDPGKLAAYVRSFGPEGIPKNASGVLDLAALGWKGQRTWFFDSRAETKLQSAGTFDRDISYHADLIMRGSSSSHGQMLHKGWFNALRWALGIVEAEDGYDNDKQLPPARRELLRIATNGAPRSEERWLFLDEPETALDAEVLMIGLCTLIRHAEIGKLRVFCASHSPMFAAGLANDPKVQVVDLGGPRPWFNLQRWAIEAARNPEIIADIAQDIAGKLRGQAEAEREARRKERERKVSEAAKGLSRKQQEVILSAFCAKDMTLTKENARDGLLNYDTTRPLEDRGLLKVMGSRISPRAVLTELGMSVAERLTVRIGKRMAPQQAETKAGKGGKPAAGKPAPKNGEQGKPGKAPARGRRVRVDFSPGAVSAETAEAVAEQIRRLTGDKDEYNANARMKP